MSFQATGLANSHPTAGTPLILDNARYNQGNAYSTSTGYFTAPFAGTYYFIGTSGSGYTNDYATLYLYVDSTHVDYVRTYDHDGHLYFASVHGVVHLNAGQRVWLRSDGHYYYSEYTTFTGFLLSPDPVL